MDGDLAHRLQAGRDEIVRRSPPHTYSNLWVIRLDADGRCAEFTEWWMQHPGSAASG
jgi:hypothetical protein